MREMQTTTGNKQIGGGSWKVVPLLFVLHIGLQVLILKYIHSHLERISEIPLPPSTIQDAQMIAQIFNSYHQTHFGLLVLFHCSCFFL